MFGCNNNRSVFCDSTFWWIIIIAIVVLWVHYGCNGIGCDNNGTDYCC